MAFLRLFQDVTPRAVVSAGSFNNLNAMEVPLPLGTFAGGWQRVLRLEGTTATE
jgi:hypothetical protein